MTSRAGAALGRRDTADPLPWWSFYRHIPKSQRSPFLSPLLQNPFLPPASASSYRLADPCITILHSESLQCPRESASISTHEPQVSIIPSGRYVRPGGVLVLGECDVSPFQSPSRLRSSHQTITITCPPQSTWPQHPYGHAMEPQQAKFLKENLFLVRSFRWHLFTEMRRPCTQPPLANSVHITPQERKKIKK